MTSGLPGAGQFLVALAQGFQETRFEIILFFLLVIVFLTVVSLVIARQKWKVRRELHLRSREILEHLLVKLDLSQREAALLGQMALHRAPGEQEHSLLVNDRVFDACARAMSASGESSPALLDALRIKVGFLVSQPEKLPASSLKLPEGSPVLLSPREGPRLRGTVVAQNIVAMRVRLTAGEAPLESGTALTIYFHNSAGIFSFPSRIVSRKGDEVHLEHSSSITYHQRRSHARRKESLPVFVRLASSDATPHETFLLDLGGGGASLRNPQGLLKKGDIFELSFSPQRGEFTLAARVLRASRARGIVNAQFVALSQKERNQIMDFISRQSRRRGLRPA
jgi:c-di-GMP-binding flagellar brake protein YcgR